MAGLIIAVIGSAIGGALAFTAFRVSASLFAAKPLMDPAIFVAVPVILGAVVMVACYIPARRAARIDPVTALRVL